MKKNLFRLDWVSTIFFILTPLLGLGLLPVLIHREGWHWTYLIPLISLWAITSFSITGGYHRFLSHRSYDAANWVKFLYLIFGAASFQGSALKWCSDHRQHHRFVDTEKDPYNIKQGFWYAHIGWIFLKPEQPTVWAPDLMKDPMIMWQHKYYMPIATITCAGFPLLMGWSLGSVFGGLVFGGFLRLFVTHHCTFFINSLCHTLGKQPYSDVHSARDSFVMALLTYGEGYHNFHHEFQADYRNGVRWYQWDPTKWSIGILAAMGSAQKLKRVTPEIILRARLIQDEKKLTNYGLSGERLLALKAKVEIAQAQFKNIRQEYMNSKTALTNAPENACFT